MIQVSKGKIRFSHNNASTYLDGDPRKRPLEFELVSAHVCPHCDVVVQAMYKTERPMRELTQEYFGLEKPMGPSKFAFATSIHQVMPKYKSYLITAGGQTAELLREESHFSLQPTVIAGQCKARRVIYYPGKFDLTRYLLGTVKIVAGTEWFQMSPDKWTKAREVLTGARAQENAEKMFNEVRSRILVSEDVSETGAPIWLLAKSDWGYFSLSSAIDNLSV